MASLWEPPAAASAAVDKLDRDTETGETVGILTRKTQPGLLRSMNSEHEYDFAISYAGPDQPFVEQVVGAMRARGLRVFFAPDEQADIVGRNLIDYLTEIYLSKARYCLMFVSKHFAERKWTDRVERPAAQARAIEQKDRYIIPVRLDDANIPGMPGTTAYIRLATPKEIADLTVTILLRDEAPAAATQDSHTRDRLILRVLSFTELDVRLLRQSFQPFAGWFIGNAHMIPVELRLPEFLMKTISSYENILESQAFKRIDAETQRQFIGLIAMIRTDLFNNLLRVPSLVLSPSRATDDSSLVLNDNAVEVLRHYVLAKVIAAARCLVSWQLKGFDGPPWARQFADCGFLWTPRLIGGLPWLCRCEGSEPHLWLDADVTGWGSGIFDRVRIYLPSVMVMAGRHAKPTADQVLRFVIPQLLEKELEGSTPSLLYDAFRYPERMEVSYRNENVVESHHFHQVSLSDPDWKEALPAMQSLRDEILEQRNAGVMPESEAFGRMNRAMLALRHEEVFLPALKSLMTPRNAGGRDAETPS